MGLVVVHELGHFWAARRNGVEVEEFGIGFPPRAWSKKTKGGWDFSINWLPLGGFVKLKGESDSDKRKGSLGAASTWSKAKIMLAGVLMNLVVAFLMLTVLALIGMPKLIPNQYSTKTDSKVLRNDVLAGYILPGSPAKSAGLQSTDKLISIGTDQAHTRKIQSSDTIKNITKEFAGKEVTIAYERDGNTYLTQTNLRSEKEVVDSQKTKEPKGYLGIQPFDYSVTRSTWSAPIVALGVMKQVTVTALSTMGQALGALFQGQGSKASEGISGPLGIVFLLKSTSLLGYQSILMAVALISLSLAIMNVLPVPALDGGRLYMILLSRLFKKQLTQEMEERIVGASFLLLLFLVFLITVVDVKRFF